MARDRLNFLRNGHPVMLDRVRPNETLLDYLRLREGAMGTKEGCNEGDCGACTVMIGRLDGLGRLKYEPVNACIQLLGQVDGKDVVAVDDLAEGGKLHPVQQAMVDHHGSQCGFCTPGIVMSLAALYHSGEGCDRQTVNDWLAGNLCRCTGYRPIADAAQATIGGPPSDSIAARGAATCRALAELDDGADLFIGDAVSFFAAPASIESLAALCAQYPDATILSGATDVGLWITKQLRTLPRIIHTGRARGFNAVADDSSSLTLGAGASYADAFDALASIDADIAEILRRLGSKQVRASGTVGGNIANGSPIGDMPPLLIALGAELELLLGTRSRRILLETFFLDYGKQDRVPGELVRAVRVPRLQEGQHFRAYKISKRFDQDISALLGAFRITVADGVIAAARIAFGGMAPTPRRASNAEVALAGTRLEEPETAVAAMEALAKDFAPISDMRASAGYRMTVAQNLLRKALAEIAGARSDGTRVTGFRENAEALA
jgi:xanthine dehydrogenase small subunit